MQTNVHNVAEAAYPMLFSVVATLFIRLSTSVDTLTTLTAESAWLSTPMTFDCEATALDNEVVKLAT
jgi:hypothetical protein